MSEEEEEKLNDPGDVSGVEMLPFDSAPPSPHQQPKIGRDLAQVQGMDVPPTGLSLGFVSLTSSELNALNVDKLDKLLEMKRSEEDRQAEREFARDFAEFQAAVPQIPKRGKGNHDAPFALYEDIRRMVDPVLSSLGFSISFGALDLSEGVARMTGTLRHKGGHKVVEPIALPVAKDLRANDTQKGGSASSYCQRYLVKAMLALVDCGEDDDGQAAGSETVTEVEEAYLLDLASQVSKNDARRMLDWATDGSSRTLSHNWGDVPRSKYAAVCKAFGRKINPDKE